MSRRAPAPKPMRVALVVMPWWSVELMPLGAATLKAVLNERGIEADCHYLNMKMAERIGPLAHVLSDNGLFSEWLFAHHLFGPNGTGELTESLKDVLKFCRRPASENGPSDIGPRKSITAAALERVLNRDIPAFVEDCLKSVPWESYDVIGFSTSFASLTASLLLARRLKAKFPGKPVVFGGANVEGVMGAAVIKGCEWIDYVVDGEAEDALVSLVRNLEKGTPHAKIPGVSFRRGREVTIAGAAGKKFTDLTRLPPPDHDDYFKQYAATDKGQNRWIVPAVTFEASRGCWWGEKQHCTFCGQNGQGMVFRSKSAEAVAEEVVRLHRKHRVRHLHATDNIIAHEHLKELLPRLAAVRRENGLDWVLFFETKSNLSPAQVDALAAAGVTHLQLGIESLSTPILRLMRKGVRGIQNLHSLKMAQGRGITLYWNFLFGFPGEDAAEYDRVAALVPSLSHLPPPLSYAPLRIDRFSPYHFDWERLGTGRPVPHEFYRFIYPRARFALDDIAYIFEFPPSVRETRRPALEAALEHWRNVWPRNFLTYYRGMDFVEIHDSRPQRAGGDSEYRTTALDSVQAFVFGFCENLRTFGEVVQACRVRDSGWGEKEVRAALQVLVDERWVLKEDEFYLTLAVPVEQLPSPQKHAFGLMRESARDFALPPVPARRQGRNR